jgi:hypothetical protein
LPALPRSALALLAAATLIGCASTQVTRELACGAEARAAVCIGPISAPETHIDKVMQASQQAVELLHDPGFRDDIAAFQRRHASMLSRYSAWQGLDADGIVNAMRAALPQVSITSHDDGRSAWLWYNPMIRNRAFEGRRHADGSLGPLSLNAFALRSASLPQVVNSIVHEVAHAAGMAHPSYEREPYVGLCEPPYVLGSIAERRSGGELRSEFQHCRALIDMWQE